MKLGLVITCKNAWAYTEAALASVRYDLGDLFVCVVDDGSTDGTKAGLKAWQSEDKAARRFVSDPPFNSLADKWNLGIKRCWDEGCEYVCVSNNDVLFHAQTLSKIVQRLAEGDVVMATAHNIEGDLTAKGIPPEFIMDPACVIDSDVDSESPAPDFSCFAISRACWEQVGHFDNRFIPAYFEDNDYHERIVRMGLHAVALAAAPYYHFGSVTRDHDQTPDSDKHKSFEATRGEFYRKWGFVPHGNAVLPSKIKLLVVGDGDRPTGFARVTHSVLERLAETGDFDIHHMAINYFGDPPGVPWRMYPAHLSNPPDMFGRARLGALYDELKPDAVFMVQDPWHITEYIRARAGMRGMTCYYPVDSPNQKPEWMTFLARCPEVCTYTHFGAEQSAIAASASFGHAIRAIAEQHGPGEFDASSVAMPQAQGWHDANVTIPLARLRDLGDPGAYQVIPHGVDTAKFWPVDKATARSKFGIKPDHFVVGYLHRNQPRKRQDLMLRAWSKFTKGLRDADTGTDGIHRLAEAAPKITDATLVIHAPMDALAGWDLWQLVEAYGLVGSVVFTQATKDQDVLSEKDLNLLVNALDVNANLGGGEGWGLSHMETAVVGVAQLVPDWSATREIWQGNAELVRVGEVYHADHSLNTAQGVVDTDAAADALLRLYEDAAHREALGAQASALVHEPRFDWDNIAEMFRQTIIRAAIQKGVPERTVKFRAKAA